MSIPGVNSPRRSSCNVANSRPRDPSSAKSKTTRRAVVAPAFLKEMHTTAPFPSRFTAANPPSTAIGPEVAPSVAAAKSRDRYGFGVGDGDGEGDGVAAFAAAHRAIATIASAPKVVRDVMRLALEPSAKPPTGGDTRGARSRRQRRGRRAPR